MMRRGSPPASRSSRSIEPYDSIGEPRTMAISSDNPVNRRDERSWQGVVSSLIQAVSVAASQYSSRPSKRSISVRGRRTGLQPGNAGGWARRDRAPSRSPVGGASVLAMAPA